MTGRKAGLFVRCCLLVFITGFANISSAEEIDPAASMNGRYSELLQKIYCPEDSKLYGEFKEYGYRAGENWCGVAAATGYLVWVSPNWYVWRRKARSTVGNNAPHVPGYDVHQARKRKSSQDCRPVHTSIVVVNPC